MSQPILPGATIGVFGSGQLGRMLAIEARYMGYGIHTFSPRTDTPTGQVGDREVSADYEDLDAVRKFVRNVDVVTFEFENVAAQVADVANQEGVPVRPGGWVLHTAQQRSRESTFLAEAGLPVTPFAHVVSLDELRQAVATIGLPAVLKTVAFGYDGKGQALVESPEQVEAAWTEIGRQEAILEAFVDFDREVSVVAARGLDGEFVRYPTVENIHRNHILDISIAPARVPAQVDAEAGELARAVLEALDVVGVLCVEFFLTGDDRLLVNEIAPRPHNSGHLTVDAAVTSQFEQQLRAICGLPLGSTELPRPAVMVNLLGDLWQGGEPDWPALLAFPTAKLHLYGKRDARLGRKMGHVTVVADSVDEALSTALAARRALSETALSETELVED